MNCVANSNRKDCHKNCEERIDEAIPQIVKKTPGLTARSSEALLREWAGARNFPLNACLQRAGGD